MNIDIEEFNEIKEYVINNKDANFNGFMSRYDRISKTRKYSGSTLDGELITMVTINHITCEAHVITKTRDELFYITDCYEGQSADSVLCEIQDNRRINISKY